MNFPFREKVSGFGRQYVRVRWKSLEGREGPCDVV